MCLKLLFKRCVALALLPKNKVEDVFVDMVLEDAPVEKYPLLQEFLEYMTTTWVDSDSFFDKALWNHWYSFDRTNNNNEAYNRRLGVKLKADFHPNIWIFIELIQKKELLIVVKAEHLENGTLKKRGRCKKDLLRDLEIVSARAKYLESYKTHDNLCEMVSSFILQVPEFA